MSAPILKAVVSVEYYKASDGKLFTDEALALDYQKNLDFAHWCRDNICSGGCWSADMVARAITENWNVTPK